MVENTIRGQYDPTYFIKKAKVEINKKGRLLGIITNLKNNAEVEFLKKEEAQIISLVSSLDQRRTNYQLQHNDLPFEEVSVFYEKEFPDLVGMVEKGDFVIREDTTLSKLYLRGEEILARVAIKNQAVQKLIVEKDSKFLSE